MKNGTIILMYHELYNPSRPPFNNDKGYLRYVVSEDSFRSHLSLLSDLDFNVISLSQSLTQIPASKSIVITFDDGCESDFTIAAPLLIDFNYSATFYIVSGFINTKGYLSAVQLRELHRLGFEIGCHSMTHAYLSDLSTKQLKIEITEAKDKIEQIIGNKIYHFSCPGGRWNKKIAYFAKNAGFLSLATSQIGINSLPHNNYSLRRVSVYNSSSPLQIIRTCSGKGIFRSKIIQKSLNYAKFILGNTKYDRLRSTFLSYNSH